MQNAHESTAAAGAALQFLQRQLEQVPAPADQARLYYEMALVFQREIGDPAQAQSALVKALQLDAQNLDVLRALAENALQTQHWEEAAKWLEKLSVSGETPAVERAGWAALLGEIQAQRLQNPDAAIQAYRQALGLQTRPPHARARAALEDLLSARQDFTGMVELLQASADALDDPDERVAVLYRLAWVQRFDLKDPVQATRTLQSIVQTKPDHLFSIRDLIDLYAERQDFPMLADAYEQMAAALKGRREANQMLTQAAQVWLERVGNRERAVLCLEQVLKEDPQDRKVLELLHEHYANVQAWNELRRVVDMELALARDAKVARGLRLALGEACERLGDSKGAIAAYRQILVDHPKDLAVLRILGAQYCASQDWSALAELYDNERAATEDPAQVLSLVLRQAVLYERHLRDHHKAIECYHKATELWPQNPLLVWELQRLYALTQNWQRLSDSLTQELQVVSDPQRKRNILEELGDLYRDHFNDLGRAAGYFQEILKLQPTDLSSIRKLQILLIQSESWKDLTALLGHQISHTKDPVQSVGLYLQAAEIFDQRLKQFDSAFYCYQKALEILPHHLPTIHGMGSMLYRQGDWSKLLGLYQKELQLVKETAQQAVIHYRMGQVLEKQLQQNDAAAASFQQALQLVPDYQPAVESLLGLYERARDWAPWAALLQGWAQKISDPEQRSMALVRLAQVRLNHLQERQQAQNDLLIALQIHPGNTAAQRMLMETYERQGLWNELSDLLRSLVEQSAATAAANPGWAITLRQRLAEIREQHFKDLKGACEQWEGVMALDAKSRVALNCLERLYRATQNWPGLLKVLNHRGNALFNSPQPKNAVPILEEMAYLCLQRLNDEARSVAYFQKVLEMDPLRVDAFQALKRLFRQSKRWNELSEVLRQRIRVLGTADPASSQLLDLYEELAAIFETALQRLPEAVTCWTQVQKARPTDALVFKSLERLYLATRDAAHLGELYEQFADHILVLDEKVRTLVLAGEIFAVQLKQPERARKAFERAVALDPSQGKAWDALRTLHETAQDWPALLATNAKLLEIAQRQKKPAGEQVGILRQSAQVYETKLGDRAKAAQVLQQALDLMPDHLEICAELVRLHKVEKAWDSVLSTYSHWIGQIKDPPQSVVLYHDRGLVLEKELNQPDYAVLHYEKALAVNPLHLPSLVQIAQLYMSRKQWEAARDVLDRWVVTEQDADVKKRALLMLGNVWIDGLNDSEKALKRFEEALAIDPQFLDALNRLASLYERKQDWTNLGSTLEKTILQQRDPRSPVAQAMRIKFAATLADRLKQTDRAIAEYKTVLKHEPERVDAQVALAELYSRNMDSGFTTQAINEYRKVLELDFVHVDTYRALAKIYEKMGQYDKVFCLYRILEVLGAATQTERSFLADNRDKANREFSQAMSDDDRQRYLAADGLLGPPRDFILHFAVALDKMSKGSIDKYGFKKTDRLTPQSKNAYRDLCDKIAVGFGVGEYDFYVGKDGSSKNEVVSGEPVSLVMSPVILRKVSVEEQRFVCGTMLFMLRERTDLAQRTKDEELRVLMRAARKGFQAQQSKTDARFVGSEEQIFTELEKGIPRKTRKEIIDYALKLKPDDEKFDAAAWRRAIEWTTLRAGLLASRDVANALAAIRKLDAAVETIDFRDLKGVAAKGRELPYLRDLFLFAASDEYFALRKRLGIAIL